MASRGYRERVCCDCGKVEQVGRYNPSTRCRPCGVKAQLATKEERGIRPGKAPKEKVPNCSCEHCGKGLYRTPSQQGAHVYCSPACRSASRSVDRVCKCCGATFKTQIGRLSGKTNSSANFCSRPCYERWLCDTERTKNRGSRWNAIRKTELNKAPFCGMCGKLRGRIEVHHIVPYRMTQDNTPENLIPLCASCHKKVEVATVDAAHVCNTEELSSVMSILLRFRQNAVFHALKRMVSGERLAA